MNRAKKLSILACLVLLAVALPPNASADEWNKKTILTVNEPLIVPGKVLQPGKYVMKLMDSPSNRHIVQIFNEDESQLQTTILAMPDQRLQPTGKTQFGFWEMPAGQPKALRSWFYPGDNFGQAFAYPKDMAAQIAKATNENVPAIVSGEDNLSSAEVKPMTPQGNVEGEENQQAAAAPAPTPEPAPAPAPQTNETAQAQPAPQPAPASQAAPAQPAPEPAPSTNTGATSSTLPSTASPFPLVGLGGLLSLGSALVIRAVSRKRS